MMPVCKMPAMREVKAENRVSRLQYGGVSLHVRLGSGMRLHVCVLRAKKLLCSIARQILDNIGKLASAVVPLSGIPLGILIRKHRSGSFEHSFADKVLGSNQLQPLMLAPRFVINRRRNLRISFVQRTVHPGVFHVVSLTWYMSARCSSM